MTQKILANELIEAGSCQELVKGGILPKDIEAYSKNLNIK